LLRWFEGLAPAEIAARLGIPVATVHSRQQRALALLRGRLDRAHGGDRSAWSAVVMPLAGPVLTPAAPGTPFSSPWSTTLVGQSIAAILMKTKLTLALVLALAVATLLVWKSADGPASSAHEAHTPSAATAIAAKSATRAESTSVADVDREQSRTPVLVAESASNNLPANAVGTLPRWTVSGRVLDATAQPRPGLLLKTTDSADLIESASYGRFQFETSAERGTIVCANPRWVTVRNGLWSKGSSYEPLVIAAPAIELRGLVVDVEGRPLENARVMLEMPPDFAASFGTILEATQPLSWTATCDALGAFVFERVPAIANMRLWAVLEGYQANSIEAPQLDARDLQLVLERPTLPLEGVVRGRVIDFGGRPLQAARVALGLASTSTNAQGEFTFDLARAVTSERILAVIEGMQPASLERPGTPAEGVTGWPDFVELRLGAAALSIAGQVVDAAGEPVRNAKVWIGDPTPFGAIGAMPAMLESLMAGASVPPQAFEMKPPQEDGDHFRDWTMPARASSALWNWVATDSEGHFEIGGLADRSYRLKIMLEQPLCIEDSRAIAAGTRDARVRLDQIELIPLLQGRVVSDRGAPVPGVRVQTSLTVQDIKGRVFGGTNQVILIQNGPATTTDSEGRFELKQLPRKGAKLNLSAESIVPEEVVLTPTADFEDFQVVVHQRCHLQVELLPPQDRADEFRVVDAQGRSLDLLVITGNSVNAYTAMELNDGRSEVVSTSSQARTLLLFKQDQEVGRVPLDLLPGEVNRVRL
jgi:protocatechuate 3,4-dioxygenase beta subunit